MPRKLINALGQQRIMACDGNCAKAWGIQCRPRVLLSRDDPDEYVYLPDDMLGTAPPPGQTGVVSEGSDMKPSATSLGDGDGEAMNHWCFRQCERSVSGPAGMDITLPDMNHPQPNKHGRRIEPSMNTIETMASNMVTGIAELITKFSQSGTQPHEMIVNLCFAAAGLSRAKGWDRATFLYAAGRAYDRYAHYAELVRDD